MNKTFCIEKNYIYSLTRSTTGGSGSGFLDSLYRFVKDWWIFPFRITVSEIMYSIHDELPPPAASATASEEQEVAEAAKSGMFCLKRLPSSSETTRTTTLASTTVVTVMPKEDNADQAATASTRLPTGLHNTKYAKTVL